MRNRHRWWYGLALVIILGAYTAWSLIRPLPLMQGVIAAPALNTKSPEPPLAWPAEQAAVKIVGSSITAQHGNNSPVPTASTAKLITALTVLQKKPLQLNQPGPAITLTASDVAIYQAYVAQGGSVVPVVAGETISEYQMLQAILLPSANNMADSLAIWAYGSMPAYTSAAQAYLAQYHLTNTKVGSDASGFAPSSTSTATDLAELGVLAMQNPVISQIVGQSTAANIPLAGIVKNVNWLLGTAGIIGVKTGNTDQAGGVFISASKITVNQRPLIIVAAIANAPNLYAAMRDNLALVKSAQANFPIRAIIKTGDKLGYYSFHGQRLAVVAAQDLSVQSWNGAARQFTPSQLKPIKYTTLAGTVVGSLSIQVNGLPDRYNLALKLQSQARPVTIWWRLSHPL